jgi:hypothetical protein
MMLQIDDPTKANSLVLYGVTTVRELGLLIAPKLFRQRFSLQTREGLYRLFVGGEECIDGDVCRTALARLGDTPLSSCDEIIINEFDEECFVRIG